MEMIIDDITPRDYQPVTEMVGPFVSDEYKIACEGCRLPYLTAYPLNPQHTEWDILVDGRIAFRVPQDALDQVIPLLANAMAVAAGWPSYSTACQARQERPTERGNAFGTRMMGIESSAPESKP